MSGSAGPARGSKGAGQVLPDAEFVWDRSRAALVVIDPQNDFLSPDGAGWPVFGQIAADGGWFRHLEIRSYGATGQHYGNEQHAMTAAEPII